jgi:hypothetical protein
VLSTNTPEQFPMPWGANAVTPFINSIPVTSQIGIVNGRASLETGFPPLTFVPETAGGTPPFGGDFNGILNLLSRISQWAQAGGGYVFSSDFSTAIGGYPNGAILNSAVVRGRQWLSTADNNTTDPDSVSAANWVTPTGQNPVGTPVPSFSSTVPFGSVAANGLTIGNASSNATSLANSTTLLLYRFVWSTFSNAECPLLNSAGAPVSRGANPDADYAANNQLTLPNAKGASLIGVDGMGGSATTLLNGVPVVIGNTTTPGSILGENLHTLTAAQIPSITSSVSVDSTSSSIVSSSGFFGGVPGSGGPGEALNSGANVTVSSNGSATSNNTGGQSHNTVHRSMTVYWNLAL